MAEALPPPDDLVDEILCNASNRGVCYMLKSKHQQGSIL